MTRRISKNQIEDVISLSENHTYDEIHEITGVSKSSISRILKSNDRLKKNQYAETRREIQDEIKDCKSVAETARKLGIKYKKAYYYVAS